MNITGLKLTVANCTAVKLRLIILCLWLHTDFFKKGAFSRKPYKQKGSQLDRPGKSVKHLAMCFWFNS